MVKRLQWIVLFVEKSFLLSGLSSMRLRVWLDLILFMHQVVHGLVDPLGSNPVKNLAEHLPRRLPLCGKVSPAQRIEQHASTCMA